MFRGDNHGAWRGLLGYRLEDWRQLQERDVIRQLILVGRVDGKPTKHLLIPNADGVCCLIALFFFFEIVAS